MAYGIQILNADGIVQIDSDYVNYAIYSTGTISNTDTPPYGHGTITLPNIEGVKLFVQPPAGVYLQLESHLGAGITSSLAWSIDGAGNPTIPYIICVPSAYYTDVNSGYGINIYKSDGSLAFSSKLNYAKVIGVVTAPLRTNSSHTLSAPSSNIYVDLALTQYAGWFEYTNVSDGYQYADLYLTISLSGSTLLVYSSYPYHYNIITSGDGGYGSLSHSSNYRSALVLYY